MTNERQAVGAALRALLAEVRDDLEAVATLTERVAALLAALPVAQEPPPTTVMAAAGYLHHLYTGCEAIHERIVRCLDGHLPQGERWHQELLTLAGLPVPGVRPALLKPETRARLSRLLRFRHFFRHAYRIDLLWQEVEPLLRDAPALMADYEQELMGFCAHLEQTLEAIEP